MLRANRPVAVLMLATTLAMSCTAWAQEKPGTREREGLRRAQQLVQQARQEKTALEAKMAGVEAEKATVTQEKDKLASQVRGAQAKAKEASAKSQQLLAERDALVTEKQGLLSQKAELEKRLADMTAKQADTERLLNTMQVQKKQADATLETRERQLASCEVKNVKLYQHGRDLMNQCQDQNASGKLLRMEPFTGIKRVELENLLEEYRDKLDGQKMLPADTQK